MCVLMLLLSPEVDKDGGPVVTMGHFRNHGAELGGTEIVFVREYLIALVQAIFNAVTSLPY